MHIDITAIVQVIVPVVAFAAGTKYGVKVAAAAIAAAKVAEADVAKVEQAVAGEVKKIEGDVHL